MLACKQLRNPERHMERKNKHGYTLLEVAIGLEEEHLAVSLLEAGESATAVNAEKAWKAFVCAWVNGWHEEKFFMVLKAFIARLGDSVDITCESLCESTLHRYGEHLVAIVVAGHSFGQERMPNDVNDFIRCLFLLLDAGCHVNARDMLHELPFQTSVFGELSSITAIPLLGDMWKMLAAAGSRLHLSFSETQKLTIVLEDSTTEKMDDLLSLHALGLLTAHSDEAKHHLRDHFGTSSVYDDNLDTTSSASDDTLETNSDCDDILETNADCDDVIAKLCQPLSLKNLCLNSIRMNCYPNAFVGASQLPLPAKLQERVRPFYQTYSKQFGRIVPKISVTCASSLGNVSTNVGEDEASETKPNQKVPAKTTPDEKVTSDISN